MVAFSFSVALLCAGDLGGGRSKAESDLERMCGCEVRHDGAMASSTSGLRMRSCSGMEGFGAGPMQGTFVLLGYITGRLAR